MVQLYIFQKSGLNWNRISKLITNTNPLDFDEFGYSTAMNYSGNLAVIGSPFENNSNGGFYIATGNSKNWNTGAHFIGKNILGYRVNINGLGNQIIATAIEDGLNSLNKNGVIHIYTGDKINWKLKKSITGEQHLSYFGESITTNYFGDTILVGAPNFNTGSFGTYAVGKVYFYTGNQNDFRLAATFTGVGNNPSANVGFGASCSLNKDGNIALIGAPYENNYSGAVYIFTGYGNNWIQKTKIKGFKQNCYFGGNVILNNDGNMALISEPNQTGAIYVFTGQNENWIQIKKIESLNPSIDGYFGSTIALDKNQNNLFIGTQEDYVSGRVYIYEDFLNDQTNSLYLNKNLPTGTLYVTQDNFNYEVTGSNLKLYHSNENYNNERIWLNGIFQNKNENYLLTSCINTMLQATGDIETKNESIFNNEYYRFI